MAQPVTRRYSPKADYSAAYAAERAAGVAFDFALADRASPNGVLDEDAVDECRKALADAVAKSNALFAILDEDALVVYA